MNKFAELAARSAALHKKSEERADALALRFAEVEKNLDAAFLKHENAVATAEAGVQSLEEAARALVGHNGGPPTVTS